MKKIFVGLIILIFLCSSTFVLAKSKNKDSKHHDNKVNSIIKKKDKDEDKDKDKDKKSKVEKSLKKEKKKVKKGVRKKERKLIVDAIK